MAEKKTVFNELFAINVNDKTEERDGLTYLSWSYAWGEVVKRFPDASYEIMKQENGLPFVHDPQTGYMVFTRVTIDGQTREMWLPVMDSHNRAMKSIPYKIPTKRGEIAVAAATMTDINKAIMRCLTKNLAMFGLGLYIYSGEDIPEPEQEEQKRMAEPIDAAKRLALLDMLARKGKTMTMPDVITFAAWSATMKNLEALPDADPVETKTE
jgi:hypothetical protein